MGNFDLGRGGLSSRRCLFRSSCKIYSEDVLSVFFFFWSTSFIHCICLILSGLPPLSFVFFVSPPFLSSNLVLVLSFDYPRRYYYII